MSALRSAAFFALILSASAQKLTLNTISSRPDMISGGDTLVEIKSAAGAAAKVVVTLNGRDVSRTFHADAARGSLTGLVDGLQAGANTLSAKSGADAVT